MYKKIVGKRIRYEVLYRFETVAEIIRKYKKGKLKILDVGSGHGFMPFFSDTSWTIYGIDIDSNRIRRANKAHHPNAIFMKGDAENFNFSQRFDVVLALDVIEHLDYPEKCLELISKHLVNNGLLIVLNPNRYSLWTLLYDNKLIRLENHKHYWSPNSFAKMAKKFGFRHLETMPTLLLGNAIGWIIKDYRPLIKYDKYLGSLSPNHCCSSFLVFKKEDASKKSKRKIDET